MVENLDDRSWRRREPRERRERGERSEFLGRVPSIAIAIASPLLAATAFALWLPAEWNLWGYLFIVGVSLTFGWMIGNSSVRTDSPQDIERITKKCDEYLMALRLAAAKFDKLNEKVKAEASHDGDEFRKMVKETPQTAPVARKPINEVIAQAEAQDAGEAQKKEAPRLYTRDSKGKYRRYEGGEQ